ncbi:MAG: SEC-C domain-containing protein [Ruminococcus sp.]|nr:SEC-C domain-containing protein [Ruminococcus sp.]
MKTYEIENYLTAKNERFDTKVLDCVEEYRIKAVSEKNEEQANYFWCLKHIFIIQSGFVSAINALKDRNYEEAWLIFDKIDIDISALEENYWIEEDDDKYNLVFISRMIKEYQKLFPYHHFLSRESIIQAEECSICGKPISFRHPCGHKVGKLYMGELCLRKVTKMELKAVCIVTDPFDKYAFIKIDGKEYNYGMLERLMSEIKSPYDEFYVETVKVKKPEFQNISRKTQCPCGSGKKYKRCHMGKTSELMNHHVVHMQKSNTPVNCFVGNFETWK